LKEEQPLSQRLEVLVTVELREALAKLAHRDQTSVGVQARAAFASYIAARTSASEEVMAS